MRITRRNTLVVLVLIVGAGGIVGTGAFGQVAADRDVSVETTGDSSANVNIVVDASGEGVEDASGGGQAGINFVDLNENATTTFNETLEITPQGANTNTYNIDVTSNIDGVTASSPGDVSGGTTGYVNFTIDSTEVNNDGELDNDGTITITVDNLDA